MVVVGGGGGGKEGGKSILRGNFSIDLNNKAAQ